MALRLGGEMELKKFLHDNPKLKVRSDTGLVASKQPAVERRAVREEPKPIYRNDVELIPHPVEYDDGQPPVYRIVLPYPITLNKMYRVSGKRLTISQAGRDYKNSVRQYLALYGVTPLSGNITVTVELYRPRRQGDVDNTLKVLLDVMQHQCYNNDSQIEELHIYRYDDKANPRVAVSIWVEEDET